MKKLINKKWALNLCSRSLSDLSLEFGFRSHSSFLMTIVRFISHVRVPIVCETIRVCLEEEDNVWHWTLCAMPTGTTRTPICSLVTPVLMETLDRNTSSYPLTFSHTLFTHCLPQVLSSAPIFAAAPWSARRDGKHHYSQGSKCHNRAAHVD